MSAARTEWDDLSDRVGFVPVKVKWLTRDAAWHLVNKALGGDERARERVVSLYRNLPSADGREQTETCEAITSGTARLMQMLKKRPALVTRLPRQEAR